jgi:hypothetical protein
MPIGDCRELASEPLQEVANQRSYRPRQQSGGLRLKRTSDGLAPPTWRRNVEGMNALLIGGPEHRIRTEVSDPPPSYVDIEVHEDLVDVPEAGEYLPTECSIHRYALSEVPRVQSQAQARYSHVRRVG